MKASELRIGNLILNDAVVNSIVVIGAEYPALKTPQGNYIHAQYELIKPIPLTEEWLMKFGFERKVEDNLIIFSKDGVRFNTYLKDYLKDAVDYFWLGYSHSPRNYEVRYVHQLQNLYFALTCQELEIK